MRKKIFSSIESKLADFICNGCKVATPHDLEECATLYDWLADGKDYIPFGRFKIKKGKNLDMFAKAMEDFDRADTPFKRVLIHCLYEESCGKVIRKPIITGFSKGKVLELRLEV